MKGHQYDNTIQNFQENVLIDYRQKRLLSKIRRTHLIRLKTNPSKRYVIGLSAKSALNSRLLNYFYRYVNSRSHESFYIHTSSQWIIENRDVISEKIGEAQFNLSKRSLHLLPHSMSQNYERYPRVYEVVSTFLARPVREITETNFIEFLQGYQVHNKLTLDEIFTIPLFFSYQLTDKICDVLWYLLEDGRARSDLHALAEAYSNSRKDEAEKVFSQVLTEGAEYAISFFTQLKKHYAGTANLRELNKLGQRFLSKNKDTSVEILHKIYSNDISKRVNTLLTLKEFDWDIVFKQTSLVYKTLEHDPVQAFQKLDLLTRSTYLDEIKKISKWAKLSEVDLAELLIKLSQNGIRESERHVGYYLIDQGRGTLEQRIGKRFAWISQVKVSPYFYLSEVTILISLLYAVVFTILKLEFWQELLIGVLLLSPVYMFIRQILDTITSRFTEARKLPKLTYKGNLEKKAATMFVVPSFLTSAKDVDRLCSLIETIFLGNKARYIYFCLLLDYRDSHEKVEKQDKHLQDYLQEQIFLLNEKYGYRNKFGFFLRKRIWSTDQNVWMGWERKRGKVMEFLSVLRNRDIKSEFEISFDAIPSVNYLVTVDEDSTVPKDFIKDLVGTIMHPLNHAEYDLQQNLIRGYVILQPRVDYSFVTRNQSVLTQQICEARGFDYYSYFVNELNFDLFSEGHYTGKGILEIDPFLSKLSTVFADNTILSHDLLEGSIVGTGYLSDIKLFEGFPSTVRSYFLRRHRWDRGDWQILNWLRKNIKNRDGIKQKNPLTILQKSKLLHNQLSSLLEPSIFIIFLLSSFTPILYDKFGYIVLSTFFIFLPLLLGLYHIVFSNMPKPSVYNILSDFKFLAISLMKKNLFDFLFLPYAAYLRCDAIIKALVRRFILHKNVLEWTTFSSGEGSITLYAYIRLFGVLWSLLLLSFGIKILQGDYLYGFVTLFWVFVPVWIYLYDRKMKSSVALNGHEELLRDTAYRTWDFFSTYTSSKTSFLPPDNIQGKSDFKVSSYTSITNIGYYLLSTFCAYSMGYISLYDLVTRVEKTMETVVKLERFRGHFYNWYDTLSLAPSRPWFISSVDSGNFLACLVTLVEGMHHAFDSFKFGPDVFAGLQYTLGEDFKNSGNEKIGQVLDMLHKSGTTIHEQYSTFQQVSELLSPLKTNAENGYYLEKSFGILEDLDVMFKYFYFDDIDTIEQTFKESHVNQHILQFKQSHDVKELLFNLDVIDMALKSENFTDDLKFLERVIEKRMNILALMQRKEHIVMQLEALIEQMDFSFLFSKKHMALSIGYKVKQHRLEKYHYGILATESRLAVFLAIAKNDVPKKAWTALKRQQHKGKSGSYLMAWSGTVFEYFMPVIFMRYTYESMYQQTLDNFLKDQKTFADKLGIPWGFSESMYAELTPQGRYKYKAFGFAEAALNPNVDKRLVVSPYSSFMALHHDLEFAMKNIHVLEEQGARGPYGFYESVDYSLKEGKQIVYAFMSHHQGMIMTSLCNVFKQNLLVHLFHSNKMVRSVAYLLEENKPGKIERETVNLKNLRYVTYEN